MCVLSFIHAEYVTGDMDEGSVYQMVCPNGYYVYVDSAFYGNDLNNCMDMTATTKLKSLCHGNAENCSFSFNTADFGDPCWQFLKTGNATLFCASKFFQYYRDYMIVMLESCYPLTFTNNYNVIYIFIACFGQRWKRNNYL